MVPARGKFGAPYPDPRFVGCLAVRLDERFDSCVRKAVVVNDQVADAVGLEEPCLDSCETQGRNGASGSGLRGRYFEAPVFDK